MYQEFDHLLEEQSPIESYIEWLDTMVDRCVVKVGRQDWEAQPWALQPITHLGGTWVVQSPTASHLEAPQQPRGLSLPPLLQPGQHPLVHWALMRDLIFSHVFLLIKTKLKTIALYFEIGDLTSAFSSVSKDSAK